MWALKRKFLIVFTFIIIIISFSYVVYSNFYKKDPTCFDKTQNGTEEGVDCGGVCEEVCSFKATDVNVFWSRIFHVADGVSNMAALIENPNFDYALNGVFSIKVLDEEGIRLVDFKKKINLYPSEKRLLFLSSLETGEESLKRAFVKLEKIDSLVKAAPIKNKLEIISKRFDVENNNLSKVSIIIKNEDLVSKENIEIAVVLYDREESVLDVGKTFLSYIGPREEKEVYVTWPKSFEILPTQTEVFIRIMKNEELFF